MPRPDLLGDSILTPTISTEGLPAFDVRSPKSILVTGASGFLGAYLVHEIAQHSKTKIYCVVRAGSPAAAMERVRRNLMRRGLWWEGLDQRIEALPGDLGKPMLGLGAEQAERLSSEIEVIVHNGALVDFVRPYAMLRPANIDGTVEILRFASKNRIKPVHFISTLSVFPPVKDGEDRVEPEDSQLDFSPDRLHGGYAQSKWAGERLCMQGRERGIPVNIYRPGVILGPSGIGNAADFFHLLLKGCLQLGLAPSIDMQFNLTPADYVAPAIVHLLLSTLPLNRAYHLSLIHI